MAELCQERRPHAGGRGVTDDPIGEYLARLRRSLRGRPNRDRMLAETEDHLRESAAHLEDQGLTPASAAQEAVRRMGDADELGRAAGGRVAAIVVLVVGWVGAAGLLAAADAVHGSGQDGPAAGAPILLTFGALAAGVIRRWRPSPYGRGRARRRPRGRSGGGSPRWSQPSPQRYW